MTGGRPFTQVDFDKYIWSDETMKHTKGPWRYSVNVGPTRGLIVEEDGTTILELVNVTNDSRFEANIRHIVKCVNAAGFQSLTPHDAWLLETVPSFPRAETHYFCSDGDWCSNANHAYKFGTEEEASEKARTMRSVVRVASHKWEAGPYDPEN